MNRFLNHLDSLLGLTFVGALAAAAITALPGNALAADAPATDVVQEARSVGPFEAVQTDSLHVIIKAGATSQVQVQSTRKLIADLETVVEDTPRGKTLMVRNKAKGWSMQWGKNPTVVTVTVPQLSGVAVNGSGDVVVETMKLPRLLVGIRGSGDVKLNNITVDDLTLAISGSGDIGASGQAAKLAVSIAGSGDVHAMGLKADDVSVKVAGSGDARVHANKTLAVSVAGSGDVVYSGNAVVTQSIAGAGSVTKQ